jgi:hypothetical protein
MATNLFRHARNGEIILRRLRAGEGSGIDVLALDRGPGMQNVAECLRDGFSSGGTAGNGLGAIRRLADEFEIVSTKSGGTAIWVRVLARAVENPDPLSPYIIGAVNLALASEEVCGDCWDTRPVASDLWVIVADGLGHGVYAHDAAQAAVHAFHRAREGSLPTLLHSIHEQLRQSRGAAAALLAIRPGVGTITSCAIGNIAMRVVREGAVQHLISNRGTVGGNTWTAQEFTYPWTSDSMAVVHSDGLTTNWNLDDHPGLLYRHPGLIAGVLYRDYHRERDDATVLVIKHRSS